MVCDHWPVGLDFPLLMLSSDLWPLTLWCTSSRLVSLSFCWPLRVSQQTTRRGERGRRGADKYSKKKEWKRRFKVVKTDVWTNTFKIKSIFDGEKQQALSRRRFRASNKTEGVRWRDNGVNREKGSQQQNRFSFMKTDTKRKTQISRGGASLLVDVFIPRLWSKKLHARSP